MSEEDVMREKIREWKEAHRDKRRDFDFDLLCSVIDLVNDSSAVKVARNPLDKDRNWNPDAQTHNVRNLTVDDQGRLTLTLRKDNEAFTVEKFGSQLRKLKKKVSGASSAVMVQISETETVQLTDVYSHSLVKDSWAGLPFDLVLGYFEEDPEE